MSRPTDFVFDSTQYRPIDTSQSALQSLSRLPSQVNEALRSSSDIIRAFHALTQTQRAQVIRSLAATSGVGIRPLSNNPAVTDTFNMQWVTSEYSPDVVNFLRNATYYDSYGSYQLREPEENGNREYTYIVVPVSIRT